MIPIIQVKNLSVVYDKGLVSEVKAIENINLEIYPEEFIIIFGPSGCGKSTLLYTLAGIERRIEDGSEIWVKGKNLADISKEELTLFHRQSMGMIFQAFNLIGNLTVAQNIALPQIFAGVDIKERGKRTKILLDRLNIAKLADRLPQHLSGGQQQRVGIARALINNTDILLADEPVGNLDSENAINVLTLIEKLNKEEKKTIILVTHEAQYIQYGSRVFYMKDGKVIKEEKVEKKTYSEPEEKTAAGEKTEMDKSKEQEIRLRALTINLRNLSYYFGLNLTIDEAARFQNIVDKFFKNDLSKEHLLKILDAPFKEGGVGLYKTRAKKMARDLEQVKALINTIQNKSEESEDGSLSFQKITSWLINDYGGAVSSVQYERLEQAVKQRIFGKLDSNEFQNLLDKPISENGVGFHWQTARNLTRKLEIIIR